MAGGPNPQVVGTKSVEQLLTEILDVLRFIVEMIK